MYEGKERRQEVRQFCEGHIDLCKDMAIVKTTLLALDKRINGSISAMENHMKNSRGRNMAISLAFLGMLTFLLGVSFKLGANAKQLEINTDRWEHLMEGQEVK